MKRAACLLVALVLLAGCASPPAPAGRSSRSPRASGPSAPAARKAARVMLLIDEKSLGTMATSETEAMAIRMLRENGFEVVDQEMVRSNMKKDQALLKSVGDNRGAAALGLEFGAELVIVGEAVAEPSARRIAESNLRNYQAAVTVRAIRTDNAETIASSSGDASLVALEDISGGGQALRQAGEKALRPLIASMAGEWEGSGGTSRISLIIGGVDAAWKLKAVRESLRGRKDAIRNALQRSYTAGVATFDVESMIPAEELSEKLVLQPPEGMKFQVLQVAGGKIELRAVEGR